MKIVTWNVRDFGTVKKKCMVRNIIRAEKLDMIGLTETKHQEINRWEMKQCWGSQEIDWVHVTARQSSGGNDIILETISFLNDKLICNASMGLCNWRISRDSKSKCNLPSLCTK